MKKVIYSFVMLLAFISCNNEDDSTPNQAHTIMSVESLDEESTYGSVNNVYLQSDNKFIMNIVGIYGNEGSESVLEGIYEYDTDDRTYHFKANTRHDKNYAKAFLDPNFEEILDTTFTTGQVFAFAPFETSRIKMKESTRYDEIRDLLVKKNNTPMYVSTSYYEPRNGYYQGGTTFKFNQNGTFTETYEVYEAYRNSNNELTQFYGNSYIRTGNYLTLDGQIFNIVYNDIAYDIFEYSYSSWNKCISTRVSTNNNFQTEIIFNSNYYSTEPIDLTDNYASLSEYHCN
ncbi:hypothetical protein KMW28_22195 [Flammeovirga yaeyamensis]|uniref:DUF4595 domain-containing protein n=1 Tax=Flammeovirga yaeyamensis TaxID=367791 RepID=A0AAX1NFT2_9BACT|nr:hypothetical protein [Flammeovirga yaeyamensis]MBB3696931.1 hypothetical protein [Flammeovirga yaeyamensis]NMF33594.1 hypothetical protein [Flammeovirga yaeyamensis]QWG05138.1 hypothetical protein KMW28_22195 [Flammeovirga yaeyamensis]